LIRIGGFEDKEIVVVFEMEVMIDHFLMLLFDVCNKHQIFVIKSKFKKKINISGLKITMVTLEDFKRHEIYRYSGKIFLYDPAELKQHFI